MSKFGFEDTSFSDFVARDLRFTAFGRTEKLQSDYWYIWHKIGLLEYLCLQMRDKYSIVVLNRTKDYSNGDIPIGYDDTVNVEHHEFYESWSRKEEFTQELENTVMQLRIHRLAFWELFNRIFYNIKLPPTPKWSGFDLEAEYHLTSPIQDRLYLTGFTKREARVIKGEIIEKLGRRNLKISGGIIDEVTSYCDQLLRKCRVLKNRKQTLLVIEEMKKYKKFSTERDENYDSGHETRKNVRQISERCADGITKALPIGTKPLNASAFRAMVRQLYQDFPLLKDFIQNC